MSIEKYSLDKDEFDKLVEEGRTSHGKLLQMIPTNSKVLECGPAHGLMTQYMKEKLNCRVYIVEVDLDGFTSAMQYAEDGICSDLEDNGWMKYFEEQSFDYILCADVLEHLKDPKATLIKLRRFLKDGGSVLLSVPNVAHGDIIMNLLCDDFSYTQTGLLDTTHVHLFARNSLHMLVKEAGFSIADEQNVYMPLFETEQGKLISLPQKEEIVRLLKSKDIYQFILRLTLSEQKTTAAVDTKRDIQTKANCCFYFDTGNGYEEKSSKKIPIKENGKISGRIPLPANCRAVRFDPAEGEGCLVRNLQLGTESTFLQIKGHNGVQLNDIYIFRSVDPQIFTEELPVGSRILNIDAEIITVEQSAWIKLVHEIEAMDQEYRALKFEAIKQREELKGQLEEVQNAYKEISNAFFWKMTKPLRTIFDFIKDIFR